MSQTHLLTGASAPSSQTEIEQPFTASAVSSFVNPTAINIDGDLKASITSEERDIVWKGKCAGQSDWFAGEQGQSQVSLGYNFADDANRSAECSINFAQASGNRPYPFMSSLNGAFPKLYLTQFSHVVVHFDMKLDEFSTDRRGWLRTSVVVALQNENSGSRIYFEQDIQDSIRAKAALPLTGGDVAEVFYTNINRSTWVHLDVPFEAFMQKYSAYQFAKSFFSASNSTFLESVYLVNECFGSGQVKYSVANWWITVENTAF
jgi:hypothetical protein